MDRLQKYNWAFNTIALFLLFGIAIYLLLRKPSNTNKELIDYLKIQNADLEEKNKNLETLIVSLSKEKNKMLLQIDSLDKVKLKIKYVYIKKDREIDTMGIGTMVNQFKIIFSKSNSKR